MSDGNINVPVKTHVPVLTVILVVLATTFGAFGISQILGVFSMLSYSIVGYITNALSWDTQIATLVIGIAFIIFAAIMLKSSNKFIEWGNQLKHTFGANIEKQPSNYYNMKVIPNEVIINHMVKERGCKSYEDPDGRGFGLYCPNHPVTNKMRNIFQGASEQFSIGTNIGILIFVNLILIFPPLAIRDGFADLIIAPWVWYILLMVILLILYDSNMLPMWSLIIIYILHTFIAAIVAPEILIIVNIAIPGLVIFFGITLIVYIFKSEHCEKGTNWWCDRL